MADQENGFVLVYYRGNNDAWDGYGGAVVYTRSPKLPESLKPRLAEACKRAGIDFAKVTQTRARRARACRAPQRRVQQWSRRSGDNALSCATSMVCVGT